MSPTPGWYTDPADRAGLRWWDGEGWTEHQAARPPQVPEPVVTPSPVEDPPVPELVPARPTARLTEPEAVHPPGPSPVFTPEPQVYAPEPRPSDAPAPPAPAAGWEASAAPVPAWSPDPYVEAPHSTPWPVPRTAPPASSGMSTSTKILIGLGIALAGLVVLGILAAIAIPVFLNQRQQEDLAALDCNQIAADAVALSQLEAGSDLIALAELKDPVLVRDERSSFRTPQPGSEAYVMTCEGNGVWADGLTERIWVDVHLTSAREPVLSLGWEE